MSLIKYSNLKSRQGNWTNLPKHSENHSNFNKKHSNNSVNSTIYKECQNNYNKMFEKKKPPNLLHDTRSSSTNNFYPNNKIKNSLASFPLNLKIPLLDKSNKNIDNKRIKNKSPIEIIKIPKTNLNNNHNKINFSTIKQNTNKSKDNRNINFTLNASNITSKTSGIFKKKIMEKNSNTSINNLSNSITFINNHKVNSLNSNSNIVGNNTNTNNNNNNNNNNKINAKFEAAQKEKERLDALYNEKIKDSKKINDKIKELENKNRIIIKKINKIKKDNDNYASTLDKIIKLIKLLKNNGFDVGDILKNLSAYDNEESEEEDEKKEENEDSKSAIKEFSFKIEDKITDSLSNKDLDTNGIYNADKKNKKDIKEVNNKKFNIKKKDKKKKKKNQIKQNEEFSFKNNKMKNSHSFEE